MVDLEEARLDDPAALASGDPGGMLPAVASAGAQVRQSARLAEEADMDRLAGAGRPRAVLVVGLGGSGVAGEVLRVVAGSSCPVPMLTHRGDVLPGWVGPVDLVVAVSASGTTEETLVLADEAARRGARLMTVGVADSALAERAGAARGVHVPIDIGGRLPRANLWALSVPLVVLGRALGILDAPSSVLNVVADLLDRLAEACGPSVVATSNPAKTLALEIAGSIPFVWGSTELAGVAAHRFGSQLNENAKCFAVVGEMPEVLHNQVVAFDGPYAAARSVPADFFRDRMDDVSAPPQVRLVLLRDVEEPGGPSGRAARRRAAARQVAEDRGVQVSELLARGQHPLERLAQLVAPMDFASVYLALAQGLDPTPITAIDELKERIAL